MRAPTIIAALLASAPAPAAVKPYVVVVGNNQSVQNGVAALQYADDDAARYFEFFRPQAARASLLTVMDRDTQRVHKDLPGLARSPTRANLFATLRGFNAWMAQDKTRGDEPILYLVFVGHGHVGAGGQGYVSLLDGPISGDDLVTEVVAKSEAAFNHLIFDACNSYLLVANRGEGAEDTGPDAKDAIRRHLGARTLARHPNTGVIMSTSQAKETHEWSVFQGGVFSQLVRSAAAGAADVNADGRIEYSELEAFLAAANLAVDDPRARIEAYVQPPELDRNRPVIDLAEGGFKNFLRLPAAFAGRFHLEDGRGVRYLDGNKTAETDVYVALVGGPAFHLRRGEQEAAFAVGPGGTVDAEALDFAASAQAARGSVAEAFRDLLLQVPYGPGFYQGFIARTSATPARRAERQFPPSGLEPRAMDQPFKDPYE